MPNGFFFGFMNVFPFLFVLVFLVILSFIIMMMVKSLRQWNKNNAQPVLTVNAKVVAKRQNVGHTMGHTGTDHMDSGHTYTDYYATFEVESGDRMELHIPAEEIGMLVEGDTGRLTFQGTRYKGFERDIRG